MTQKTSEKSRLIAQLRAGGVTDERVLAAMESIPRDRFVSGPFKVQAWEDTALPIECGQTISQPLVVAAMTQTLDLHEDMRVLEIGTGSGYQTAILAKLCKRVYTIERHEDLMKLAKERLASLGIKNVTYAFGDGSKGWAKLAPFDRIIVTAAAERVPQALVDQLVIDGIMIVPIGEHHEAQELWKLTKYKKELKHEPFMPVRFVPLVEDEKVSA